MRTRRRLVAAAGVVGVMVVAGSALAAQEVLARLGISEREARQRVLNAIESGRPAWQIAASAVKATPPAERGALISAALGWARAFVESDVFTELYGEMREERQPLPPVFEGTVDEELKADRERQLADIAAERANLAQLPAEARKGVEDALAGQEKILADPEMEALRRTGIEQQRVAATLEYERELESWRAAYPEEPRALVAPRLEAFLAVCAAVDYDAAIVTVDRAQRFVDPALERKSSDWRLCYRTGREGTEAAKAFATDWLADLEKR